MHKTQKMNDTRDHAKSSFHYACQLELNAQSTHLNPLISSYPFHICSACKLRIPLLCLGDSKRHILTSTHLHPPRHLSHTGARLPPLTLPLLLPATLLPPPTLSLLVLSTLLRPTSPERSEVELLLLLLISLASPGSCGFSPEALAIKFRTSVNEMTPERRPDSVAPGIAVAEMVDCAEEECVLYCGPVNGP
jgi:hypothetical protein